MEDRDFLKEMFECYFRYRKSNSEMPIERLSDAIMGALSGADYPQVVRDDLLNDLILDCDKIKTTTEKVKAIREQLLNSQTATAPTTIIEDTLPSSDWMNVDEVCKMFKLSKNNIKSKIWRDNNNFPYYQESKGSKTTFNKKKVEEWIKTHEH